MAKTKWIVLPGGRVKRWKKSERESKCEWCKRVPPRWFRNHLNRKEWQKCRAALEKGKQCDFPFINSHCAAWLYN